MKRKKRNSKRQFAKVVKRPQGQHEVEVHLKPLENNNKRFALYLYYRFYILDISEIV